MNFAKYKPTKYLQIMKEEVNKYNRYHHFKFTQKINLTKELDIHFINCYRNFLVTGIAGSGKSNLLKILVDELLDFEAVTNVKMIELATKDLDLTNRYINEENHFVYRPGSSSDNSVNIDILAECKTFADIQTITVALFPNPTSNANQQTAEFFTNAEQAVFASICLTLLDKNQLNYINFFKFIREFGSDASKLIFEISIAFEKYGIDLRLISPFEGTKNETTVNIMLGAMVKINKLITPLKNKNYDLFFDDFFNKKNRNKTRLSLVLDEQYKSTLDQDFRLIIGLILQRIKSLPNSEEPRFVIVLDELQNLGNRIEILAETLAISRSKGVVFIIASNSIQMLREMYKSSWDTIEANCANKFFFAQSANKDLKEITEYFGQIQIQKNREDAKLGGGQFGHLIVEENKSEKIIENGDLTSLKIGQCFYHLAGYSPAKIKTKAAKKIKTKLKFSPASIKYFNNEIEKLSVDFDEHNMLIQKHNITKNKINKIQIDGDIKIEHNETFEMQHSYEVEEKNEEIHQINDDEFKIKPRDDRENEIFEMKLRS